jgi:hypothetical protein
MSWDSYVEHLMVDLPHGGKLSSAAIVGQDGGIWAQSAGFPAVTPEQVRFTSRPRWRKGVLICGEAENAGGIWRSPSVWPVGPRGQWSRH